MVYEELIHKDQRERNINVFKGYSVVINTNTRMRFSLYCAGLSIVAGGITGDANAELFTRRASWRDFSSPIFPK